MGLDSFAAAQRLDSERLRLEPLRVAHAQEMAPALDDPALHTFIGGEPATREELLSRYRKQVVGHSPDASQRWLNWVVRHRVGGQVVGYLQATVSEQGGRLTADVAWLVAVPEQGCGYAREGAAAMAAWLRQHGVEVLVAHVHPEHHSSNSVARWIGLVPTDTHVDGEVRWQG